MRALAVAVVVVLAGCGGSAGGAEHEASPDLDDVRAFVAEHRTVRYQAITPRLDGEQRIEGELDLEGGWREVVRSPSGVEERVHVDGSTYVRAADAEAGLAEALWERYPVDGVLGATNDIERYLDLRDVRAVGSGELRGVLGAGRARTVRLFVGPGGRLRRLVVEQSGPVVDVRFRAWGAEVALAAPAPDALLPEDVDVEGLAALPAYLPTDLPSGWTLTYGEIETDPGAPCTIAAFEWETTFAGVVANGLMLSPGCPADDPAFAVPGTPERFGPFEGVLYEWDVHDNTLRFDWTDFWDVLKVTTPGGTVLLAADDGARTLRRLAPSLAPFRARTRA